MSLLHLPIHPGTVTEALFLEMFLYLRQPPQVQLDHLNGNLENPFSDTNLPLKFWADSVPTLPYSGRTNGVLYG